MFAAIGLMACPNLAVSAEVMSHIVDVESGANPYAIGVVGGQLERQPKNLAEALATVHMLDAKGYDYSLGVAQVNRANLGKYGLDSYEKAFDACPNLAAGAQILAACYASSGGDWGKAFSCYYSGDFVTGYRDGYVQKVYDSINRGMGVAVNTDDSRAIPLKAVATTDSADKISTPLPDSPEYRVAIRSVSFYSTKAYPAVAGAQVLDQAAAALTSAALDAARITPTPPAATTMTTAAVAATPTASTASTPAFRPTNNTPNNATADSSVFEPQVTGPNDPPPSPVPASEPAKSPQATSGVASTTTHTPAAHAQEPGDAAFVF
ncbi:lytic transglycosylase domain-containing protein [Rhodanobacter sp. 7MK24]|uniref:transglycosylase SLT domain-containing protein n=1 Tax=Rhodanobacter sp. 7MK24 TaxID=2775922 RepID=UPI001780893D|nr:lytic transglycosylase domain-containing protein [Rhodanobacter sp. 7MK24]